MTEPGSTTSQRLVIQLRCLRAIAVRDLLTMWRYRINFLTLFVTAVAMPAAYLAQAAGFAGDSRSAMDSFQSNAGTNQIAAFLYVGWAVYMWVSVILWGPASGLRKERLQGSLEVILVSSVSRRTLLVGMCVAHLIPTMIIFAIVGCMLTFVFGVTFSFTQAGMALLILIISVPALFALSSMLSSLTLGSRDSDGMLAFIEGTVSVLCGVTYPIVVLPEAVRVISLALPPTESILLLRNALLGSAPLEAWQLRIAYILVVGIVGFFASDRILRAALRRSQITGRLSQF